MARVRARHLDMIVAVVIATILSASWATMDWSRLSRLLLPDWDDMMRLAQVRDWLAGQGINDWTQYRMAPPLGAPMHWSRVNDFGIAAIILAATPLLGRHHAEMAAVLLYPTLLFACAIFLSAQIGRRLWGAEAGLVAAVFTALAFPGTTVFIPGRIDHHALQVVLVQLLVLTLMRQPTFRTGLAAGALAGLSLVVGLESVPQLVAMLSVLFLGWVVGGPGERARLSGFAGGLAGVTLVFFMAFRPTLWTDAYCDAFTPASVTGALTGAAAFGALAGLQPFLRDWRLRFGAGTLLGGIALAATFIIFPSCILGPYGNMDPFLRTALLPHIDEANGLFAHARLVRVSAVGGALSLACVVAAWTSVRAERPWRTTLPIAATIWISWLVMLAQVRGAYIGAPLAAPMLAYLVVAARRQNRWQSPALIAAWIGGAGIAYLELPKRAEPLFASNAEAADEPTTQIVCGVGDTWQQIDRHGTGVVMSGTSVAAFVIGATRHSTVGAGYHRNNAGNMAMYRFFLGTPDQAYRIAQEWHVSYVLFCPGDFDEIDVARKYRGSVAAGLRVGRHPGWLVQLPLRDTPLRFYRVR